MKTLAIFLLVFLFTAEAYADVLQYVCKSDQGEHQITVNYDAMRVTLDDTTNPISFFEDARKEFTFRGNAFWYTLNLEKGLLYNIDLNNTNPFASCTAK